MSDRHTRYYVREKGALVPRTLWFSQGLEKWTLSNPPLGRAGMAHNGAQSLRDEGAARRAIREWRAFGRDISEARGGDEEHPPELEVVRVKVVEEVVEAEVQNSAPGICGACGRTAPLVGGECPDCRH